MSGPAPSVQYAWDGPGALGAGDDGKALCWNQSAGRFVLTAKAPASHTHAPGDLTQGGASSGQALVWNGSAWAPAAAGVTDHGALTGLGDDDHSQYALLTPSTSARNVIQPSTATVVALVVKGKSGQTANLQQWQNSSGTVLAYVDASGGMSLSSLLALGLPIISLPLGGTFRVRDGASQALFETTHNAGTAKLYQYDAAGVALTVRGATAQSANLLSLTNVSAAVQFAIGAGGKVCTNQAVTNTNSPSGATAKALPFYDASGTLLGYAPLYASTW